MSLSSKCILGLKVWSIHFKNQTHLQIASWTRRRWYNCVLLISALRQLPLFIINPHTPRFSLLHFHMTIFKSLLYFIHQIKLTCNQTFLFPSEQIPAAARSKPTEGGQVSEKPRPCPLTLPSHHTFPDLAMGRLQEATVAPEFVPQERGNCLKRKGTQKVQLLRGGKRISSQVCTLW